MTDTPAPIEASKVELVAEGLTFPEGPVAMADGSVIVMEVERRTVSRVTPDGRISVIAEVGGGPAGAAIGPDGALYVCNSGGLTFFDLNGRRFAGPQSSDYRTGSIQRVDLVSGTVTTVFEQAAGQRLSSPNDIVFDRAGGMWFTDLGQMTPTGHETAGLIYVPPGGDPPVVYRPALLSTPNGIGLSPDESVLFVADSISTRLWAFDLPEPGRLRSVTDPFEQGRVLTSLPGIQIIDGLAVEADGSVCLATLVSGGITTVRPDGRTSFLAMPDSVTTNICFGGNAMRTAYITCSGTGRLYRCHWPRPGHRLNFRNT